MSLTNFSNVRTTEGSEYLPEAARWRAFSPVELHSSAACSPEMKMETHLTLSGNDRKLHVRYN
jgi:hypothetical protein